MNKLLKKKNGKHCLFELSNYFLISICLKNKKH